MSTFVVPVVRIDSVEKHPNADRLTLNRIGGYTCISNKLEDGSPRYHVGDLVVYIPEAAIVPEWLLRRMGFWDVEKNRGTLAGSNGDRVKSLRLRSIFSEGILYPVTRGAIQAIGLEQENVFHPVVEGQDVAEILGIRKYVPPIPIQMAGDAFAAYDCTVPYDIEPIEKFPDVFEPNEPVWITAKLHGTFTGISICFDRPNDEAFALSDGSRCLYVYSKGMGAKGLAFKDNPTNANNLYVRSMRSLNLDPIVQDARRAWWRAVHILGETYGKGVQDLHYGETSPKFRIFDIAVDGAGGRRFLNPDEMIDLCLDYMLPTVPFLYEGLFDYDRIPEWRDGKDPISSSHVNEGIVIRPRIERRDDRLGRVILKAVSPDYKLRHGQTTEFE